jgi:GT2 family glycosyltransferase
MSIRNPTTSEDEPQPVRARPRVRGKFVFAGDEKLYLRGVTYGTFAPDDQGYQYGTPDAVERDFASMAAIGVNSVRTYTVPPRWLLDAAQQNGLYVLVGLPWEQHVAFLDTRARRRSIERRVREGVRACAGHPALLAYAVGNEVPSPVVRWHGPRKVERFLTRLYRAVKEEDPGALVTYVNYPSTEYLDVSFADFVCFNVYLEQRDRLSAYLARLQTLAGDKPLVMGEIGLDSARNGEDAQAEALAWQVRTAFAEGCAGAFVFAWTDEWHRGGYDVEDWDFGLTDRAREPKEALAAVRHAFAEVPYPRAHEWPRVSVVVASYNGARTLHETLEGIAALDYPDYEVIVVDDGSTDATAAIAANFDVRLISTENRGLSNARNTGMEAASGDVVAYIDDDAVPDPHWLQYLVATLAAGGYACAGGPNLAPPGDGALADCVANAPGGPAHVLLDDRQAEHVPGCNMAFRREALVEAGRFDPLFRIAGDDVDVCWRVQDSGGSIGFSPAALVWHHRRNSLRAYLRQQRLYGRAEALLERRWPQRYNATGHMRWSGRIYGAGLAQALRFRRDRIGYGTWGSAPFQSIYEPAAGLLGCLCLMPEWFLVMAALAALSALGALWAPLLGALPALGLAVAAAAVPAAAGGVRATFPTPGRARRHEIALRIVTAALHLLQPAARLLGRLTGGLTPWRRRGPGRGLPVARSFEVWSERWHAPEEWLGELETTLREAGVPVARAGHFDRHDLEVRGGLLSRARVWTLAEEHGAGRQLVRFAVSPRLHPAGPIACALLAGLSALAIAAGHALAAGPIMAAAALLLASMLADSSVAVGAIERACMRREGRSPALRLEPAEAEEA